MTIELAVVEYLSNDENASRIAMEIWDGQDPKIIDLSVSDDLNDAWPLSPTQMWVPRTTERDPFSHQIYSINQTLYGSTNMHKYACIDFFMKSEGLDRIEDKEFDTESLMHMLNVIVLTIEELGTKHNITKVGKHIYDPDVQNKIALIHQVLEPVETMSRYNRTFQRYAKQ